MLGIPSYLISPRLLIGFGQYAANAAPSQTHTVVMPALMLRAQMIPGLLHLPNSYTAPYVQAQPNPHHAANAATAAASAPAGAQPSQNAGQAFVTADSSAFVSNSQPASTVHTCKCVKVLSSSHVWSAVPR